MTASTGQRIHVKCAADVWAQVDRRGPDDCWAWNGAASRKMNRGYVRWRGKVRAAYRVTWELANGSPIPDRLKARHTCGNPICVNPGHIIPGTLVESLASKLVANDNGCLEWKGKRDSNGYGRIKSKSGEKATHRAAWVLVNGPILGGLFVLHRCDNPPCCNVEHLFLGTNADNMRDMAAKGRGRNANSGKTHCNHGHEFTPENTALYGPERRWRYCLACRRAAVKARRRKNR